VAESIAVKAKVLRRCEYHPDQLMENPDVDVQHAYRIGNAMFTAGELKETFDSRLEMTDAIKSAVSEISLDYCGICEKMLRD